MSNNEELDIAIWRELPFDMYEYIVRMLDIDTRLALKIHPRKLTIPKNISGFQANNKIFHYLVDRKSLIEINIYEYGDVRMQFITNIDYDKKTTMWTLNNKITTVCETFVTYPIGGLRQSFINCPNTWDPPSFQLDILPNFIYDS